MKTKTIRSLSLVLFVFLTSCLKDDVQVTYSVYHVEDYAIIQSALNLPNDRVDYVVTLPEHMRQLGMTPPDINHAKATLGRVLFYDTKLSKNEAVSCASCHKQEIAFSDDKAFSEGFDGELTLRNSLALGSVPNFKSSYDGSSVLSGTNQQFFWDERAHSIQRQSELTIQDDIEMGMPMDELVERLSGIDYYEILFRKAYNSTSIDEEKITDALEEFINAMVSTNSPFDKGMSTSDSNEHANFANYSAEENRGKSLFIQHCSSCHGSNMSVSPESVANNGLDAEYTDFGVGGITNSPLDIGKFKVPFLRNIALTAPYMHDGRFETLEEVLDHYSKNIQPSPNLDHRLRGSGGAPIQLNFSEEDKNDIIAFLETLTDEVLVSDTRFADPFK
jgi:cytochrome c peroxidase